VWVPLAKAAAEEITQDDATRTVVAHLTDPGTTGGTIAYMRPEQARGQTNLTGQSDQFLLGLVLYELAAACARFSATARLRHVAIIREDPARVILALTHAPERLVWVLEWLVFRRPKGNSG
jgi:serine/threonine protein kinase